MADALVSGGFRDGIASIRASIVAFVVKEIDARTGKTDVFLAEHGLMRSQLLDPYAQIPLERYLVLFEEAAKLLRDVALGVRIGTMFVPADMGPAGLLFSGSATIRKAFERLSRSMSSVQGSTSAGLVEEFGERVVWNYRLTDERIWPRRQDAEFTLAASCQLVRGAFRPGWRPVEIHFEHSAPNDSEPLFRVFGSPVLFGQSGNRIVMEKADVDRPYRQEDPHLILVLERHINDLLNDIPRCDSLVDRVVALIAIYLGHKPITIGLIAAGLGLTPRTLQRRLTALGTSLREIMRHHRQNIADRQLIATQTDHACIASTLGYADSTAFWRAYKSWTGMPPSQRRRR